MIKAFKKSLSLVLVLVQIIVLLPILTPVSEATQVDSEIPILNKMIVGTVQFQSFNFLGDNASGSDGVDYSSTFYYSDDYFSSSSIHETSSTSLNWSDLTPNELSLASTSFDLTVAAYASNENNVLNATNRSWDNTYYPGKDKNAKSMLETCGFSSFESYNTYDQAPINDSIGYVIASKQITVWDETTQSNKEFTLIAVAVRGAGYGAEWASNVTIGDKSTNKLPSNGRHWGFDDAAKTVCNGIQSYLTAHDISGDAKYWITGFSRAGATANLVAGYVTDDAESIYHTHQRDVYGFTWECPQGASQNENALNYKNIHNIINAMDAVPKVSPDAFQHQRLGVDYVMPYYGNTTSNQNTSYYTQMREVLKTIAVGAYNYAGEYYTEDPLISVTDPSNYPYNRPMTVYTITATKLLGDALDGELMDNFGTVEATGSAKKLTAKYIDQFVDDLINVFLVSGAWNGKIGSSNTTSALNNRTKFISDYQGHFRNVLGYMLDYSGPAFLGMVDALVDAIGDQLSVTNSATNIGVGLAFLNFYNYPTSTYVFPTLGIFNDPWIGKISWRNRSRREVLVEEAQPVVKNVIRNMVGDFVDPQGITRSQFEDSMDKLVELVVNLYADELSRYNSNYFGTSLHYMWQILCTHEQEVVMSWIKSLDPNHMNRSCRTLTVPASSDVTLYEFREQYNEDLTDLDTDAPVLAKIHDGAFVAETLKDQRVTISSDGSNIVIRYPASLKIRADVKATETMDLNAVSVNDYQTKYAYTKLSDGEGQFSDGLPTASYSNVTNNTNTTNAKAKNADLSGYGTLDAGDTLHVLVNDVKTYNSSGETTQYDLSVDKAPDVAVVEYASPSSPFISGNNTSDDAVAIDIEQSSMDEETVVNNILTRKKTATVPASSVYFDDDFKTPIAGKDFGDSVYSVQSKQVDDGQQLWFKFRGTRIDVYCTTTSNTGYIQAAVYKANSDGTRGDRVEIVTMKNASNTTRYNVPTISVDGLDVGQDYYLTLNILKSSNYSLDGIRVYNSGIDSDDEAVTFINLRKLLLGKSVVTGITGQTEEGAAFYVDHAEDGEEHSISLISADYENVSPKNEIYLAKGQSVAFQINGTYDSIAVGLSAPDNKGTGTVTMTNGDNGTATKIIDSVVDTYYSVTPTSDGNVSIHNDKDVLIAVTNVRIEGFVPAQAGRSSALVVNSGLKRYTASFLSFTPSIVEETETQTVIEETAPPNGEAVLEEKTDPETTPSPDVLEPGNAKEQKTALSIIQGLLRNIARIFRR